ncbi:glycosyltransferase family 4 protein [Cucumibacter marinus]|uniref:glycosyltransferase family 4 protein n=1 Tax=Cucumibacter marinus TaxID=1121252 RepID=UPI00048DD224|nr:glycosyltransferase family 4 protein [Cucumibacter marinus]
MAAARPLSVLQVLRAPVGGLFRHVRDLTEALAARGHKVGVLVDSLTADSQTAPRLEALEAHAALGIHKMPMPRLIGAADLGASGHIADLADELGVDVIHGHGAKPGFYTRLGRRQPGPVVFYTPHGGVLHFAPGSLQGRLFHFLERRLISRSDGIFFESEFARTAYAEIVGDPGDRAEVVHNGLPEADFEPVPSSDAFDFVYVGELRDLKGIDVLIDAIACLDQPARLLVAGDGPDAEALKAKVHSLDLQASIHFAGAQPAREMFAKARCVVVPSRKESLPYIVLEGIAAGKTVIATNVGGIPEIFGDTSGDLVPAGDAEALATSLARWQSDPAGFATNDKRRLDRVRSHFSIDAMTDAIEAGYRRAIARH